MKGISADSKPTVSHGTAEYNHAIPAAKTLPHTEPMGPTMINAMGAQIKRKSIGFKKAFTTSGETRSAKSSTHPMMGVIKNIGSSDDA